MKRNLLLLYCCLAIFQPSTSWAMKSITVMADSSLGIALSEIARRYSRQNQIVVNTSYTTPKAQELQIAEGGSADILITPKAAWIEQLREQGLIDVYSRTSVARNRLALIGSAQSPLTVDLSKGFPVMALIEQLHDEPGLLIGNPEVLMEGIYSKEALRALNVADELEPYTLYIKRQSQMFDMVAKQQAYGIFFYSSTINRPEIRVLGLFPQSTHSPIEYYGVVIAGDNMPEARKFLAYLRTGDAAAIFEKNGFLSRE